MTSGGWKLAVQNLARKAGFQIRRLEPGAEIDDSWRAQLGLLPSRIGTVVEVGAADGRDSAAYAEAFPDAIVHAFEPMPASFAALQAKAAACARIRPHQLAIADEPGRATFHITAWADASSLLKPRTTGSTFDAYHAEEAQIDVDVETLDRIAERESISRIDLLKMDAQGAELKILTGARKLFSEGRVGLVYTEIQFQELYEGAARFDQLWQMLDRYGHALHSIYNIHHNQRGEICWGDAIFVPRGEKPL